MCQIRDERDARNVPGVNAAVVGVLEAVHRHGGLRAAEFRDGARCRRRDVRRFPRHGNGGSGLQLENLGAVG